MKRVLGVSVRREDVGGGGCRVECRYYDSSGEIMGFRVGVVFLELFFIRSGF